MDLFEGFGVSTDLSGALLHMGGAQPPNSTDTESLSESLGNRPTEAGRRRQATNGVGEWIVDNHCRSTPTSDGGLGSEN